MTPMSANPMATFQSLTFLTSIAAFDANNFTPLEMFSSLGFCDTTLPPCSSYLSGYFFIDSTSSARSLNIGVSQEPDLGLQLPFNTLMTSSFSTQPSLKFRLLYSNICIWIA